MIIEKKICKWPDQNGGVKWIFWKCNCDSSSDLGTIVTSDRLFFKAADGSIYNNVYMTSNGQNFSVEVK